jgi:hypothetical protein
MQKTPHLDSSFELDVEQLSFKFVLPRYRYQRNVLMLLHNHSVMLH